jgi:hypothetical protein
MKSDMSNESAAGSPDPIIARKIDDLREEHERGEISCLAVVVVRHNGDTTRSLHGAAPPVTLLGSLEMLKGTVLSKEFGDEQCDPGRLN